MRDRPRDGQLSAVIKRLGFALVLLAVVPFLLSAALDFATRRFFAVTDLGGFAPWQLSWIYGATVNIVAIDVWYASVALVTRWWFAVVVMLVANSVALAGAMLFAAPSLAAAAHAFAWFYVF